MEEAEGKKSSIGNAAMAILSTHPLSHKRMESLQQWVSAHFDADPPPPYEPPPCSCPRQWRRGSGRAVQMVAWWMPFGPRLEQPPLPRPRHLLDPRGSPPTPQPGF